jgi:hypothetical protein
MQNIKRNAEIQQFIRRYLSENTCADVLNAEFHDKFSEKFGGRRIFKMWGAMPNMLAMSWLKKLYDQGILERGRISLYAHEMGFPNWVYSYTLAHPTKREPDKN